MNALPADVVIIGAGLAGGVVLTPNGLRVLDQLGVFERITSRCWKAEFRTYKNDKDETTRKTLIANEKLYGCKNHRIWRRWLLEEMKLMLEERKLPLTYDAKFEGIVSDTTEGVTFRVNGKQKHTSMLIGADGIYSTVRNHLDRDIRPEYTGVVGVLGHIKWNNVTWPYSDYEKQFTLQGKPGTLFTMPEVADGSEIMVGMQVRYPDQSRAEWEAMAADKDKMCKMYRKGYDDWHDTAQQIIEQICVEKHNLYLWPFLRMPQLKSWYSETGRVLILGDAAHAIPPSSGQGVNQALEDVYALILLLKESKDLLGALHTWQSIRQARIDAVFDWATNSTNVQRLPEAERNTLIMEGKVKDPKATGNFDDMSWLYNFNVEEEIARFAEPKVHA